jgi:hypothetical protein
MKHLILVVVSFFFTGCATIGELASASKPKYEANAGGVYSPASAEDLTHEFVNVSGKTEFTAKVKNLSYEHMGWIYYEVPYNESTMADVKQTALQAGADGVIIWRTGYAQDPLLGRAYGISVVAIKLTN